MSRPKTRTSQEISDGILETVDRMLRALDRRQREVKEGETFDTADAAKELELLARTWSTVEKTNRGDGRSSRKLVDKRGIPIAGDDKEYERHLKLAHALAQEDPAEEAE